MTVDLKEIGWRFGIKDIEEEMKKYNRDNENGIRVTLYPTINTFNSLDEYESYLEALMSGVKKYLSESKKALKQMNIAYKFWQDDKLREMNFIHFVFNLIMWRPYIVFGIPVTQKDIFNPEVFHNKKYMEYFDRFSDAHRDKFTMAEFSEVLFDIQVYMNRLAVEIGPLFGNSISIYDMVRMAKRNAEIDAIINTEIDLENFQVKQAEDFLISQTERLLQISLNESDKNNPLKPFIRAGTGVNNHQVQESFVHLGFKPNLQGDTIPLTTNSNLMTEGLKTPEAIFIDSKGGRKAAIMQEGVAKAGYFGRHTTFVTNDITLHENPKYSCNTVNLFKVYISKSEDLETYEGRFYKFGEKEYRVITKKDKHLIGTEIELRSPVTCANKENKICKACYGILYNVNYGMHAGLYAAIDTNESKTQLGLSARHALATSSESVKLVDDKMFLINQNGWLFHLNKNIQMDKYELVFNTSDLEMENKEDYDKYDNYFLRKLIFRNIESKEIFEVFEKSGNQLYLSRQLFLILVERKFFSLDPNMEVTIRLDEFKCNEPFVFLRISNDELTKPIKELTNFIQKGEKPLKDVKDYNDYIIRLNGLFRAGGMKFPSVHIEMIIRNLIRDKENELRLPDWSIPQKPSMYRLVSLNDSAILKDSVIAGMMFEQVRRQLRAVRTYRKTGSSIYSLMFINE